MQEFLEQAAAQLGLSTDQVKSATGSILGLIQERADPADAKTMLSKIPGAEDLLRAEGEGGSGLLGALGGMLGGDTGKALGVADILSKTGLDVGTLGGLLGMLKNYVQPLLGDDLLKRLLEKVPGLGDLLRT